MRVHIEVAGCACLLICLRICVQMLKVPQKLPSAEQAAYRSMPEAQMVGRRIALAEVMLAICAICY